MDARAITEALGGKWQGSSGLCRCPSHADVKPSLKISDREHRADGVDVHCFAGCNWKDVKAALIGLELLAPLGAVDLTVKPPQPTQPKPDKEQIKRIDYALSLWDISKPLRVGTRETLGWRYFKYTRKLPLDQLGDLSHALRWHDYGSAVMALMTDAVTGRTLRHSSHDC